MAIGNVKELDRAIRLARAAAASESVVMKSITVARGLILEVPRDENLPCRWRVRVMLDGRERRVTRGTYPEIGLKAATEWAESVRAEARQSGKTVIDRRRETRAQEAAVKTAQKRKLQATFEAAARHWHTHHSAALTSPKYAAQILSTLEQHAFPVIGAMQLDDITASTILEEVLGPMLTRRTEEGEPDPLIDTCRKLFQQISAVFEDAGRRELCRTNPASLCSRELSRRIGLARKLKPEGRFAALTDHRAVGELLAAIRTCPSLTTRNALLLMAYTATRSGELRHAHVDEFDLKGKTPTWTIPSIKTKTKRGDHIVPLSTQAVALIEELLAIMPDSGLLFASPYVPDQPISDNTLSKWMRDNGYRGAMTPHGFRATFSTLATELGYRPESVEAQLAHTVPGVRGRYQRSTLLEERRKNAQAWADFLDTLAAAESA